MARKKIGARVAALEREVAEVRVKAAEAGEFRLVDKAGRVRAALEMARSGPRLAMMHEDGTVALEVTLGAQGPSVRLAGEDGGTRVFVGATREAARVGLADGRGMQRIFIGVDQSGTPSVTIYDNKQRNLWQAPE